MFENMFLMFLCFSEIYVAAGSNFCDRLFIDGVFSRDFSRGFSNFQLFSVMYFFNFLENFQRKSQSNPKPHKIKSIDYN